MAEVTVGVFTIFELRRNSTSKWDLHTSKPDDSLGPHLILQQSDDSQTLLYIAPTDAELESLRDWCKATLGED